MPVGAGFGGLRLLMSFTMASYAAPFAPAHPSVKQCTSTLPCFTLIVRCHSSQTGHLYLPSRGAGRALWTCCNVIVFIIPSRDEILPRASGAGPRESQGFPWRRKIV